jgi:PadR family transcriptional regulator, regulatory protein PadR
MRRTQLGEFELMVMLALIRLREGAYGVPIARIIETETNREVALASVYATLERLEDKGLVSSHLGDPTPERGGRARRYYNATKSGLQKVHHTRKVLIRLWSTLPELRGQQI